MDCKTPNCHTPPPERRPTGATDDHGQKVAQIRDPDTRAHNTKTMKRRGMQGGDPLSPTALVVLFIIAVNMVPVESILKGLVFMPIIILAIIVAVLVLRNVAIVPQGQAFVIERLGKYKTTWQAGLHFKIPFIDRIANKLSLKEQVLDFEPQSVITKDNVTMKIDTVIYLRIMDAQLATYGIEHALPAIENLTATTLRNLIGELTLDDTLTSRDTINCQMQSMLDEATDPWGIKVNRVELKNIMPPRDIQEAMEKQMRAEREKREAILRAEGAKEAQIRTAEGEKEATILKAEADKQRAILKAEADREAAIARAEGKAEAIRKVKDAEAAGIKAVKEAGADAAVIQLRSLSTLEQMAAGQATTIFIPSDLAGVAGGLAAVKEAISQNPSAPHADEEG